MLEALIAILIVSFGILGIVGLQARSLKAVGDAQYRGEAAFYAETLAGRMWSHDPTSLVTYFGSGGTGFTAWSDQVTAAGSGLPGASVIPPTIAFTDLNSSNGVMATITIYWQAPGDEHDCGEEAERAPDDPAPALDRVSEGSIRAAEVTGRTFEGRAAEGRALALDALEDPAAFVAVLLGP